MATVSVKNLQVDTIIGIYSHELNTPQPLFFDIDMQTNITAAAQSDNIVDALDYALVATRLQTLVTQSQKQLLEGLVVDLCKQLLEEFSAIEKLTLTVRKPNAIAKADCAQLTYCAEQATPSN